MARVPLVLPVRFAVGPRAVQSTTREVAPDGVFIRSLSAPAMGARVALKLYLPVGAPLELVAVVKEVDPKAGFYAELVGASPAVRENLAGLLAGRGGPGPSTLGAVELRKVPAHAAGKPSATPAGRPAGAGQPPPEASPAASAPGDDRRTFRRLDARFAVRFASLRDFVLEYAANISAGGVFVRTDRPPELEAVVEVALELPGEGPPARAKAVVVHRVTQEEARARGLIAGAGVQFIDADDAFRERIDEALEHILRAGGDPGAS